MHPGDSALLDCNHKTISVAVTVAMTTIVTVTVAMTTIVTVTVAMPVTFTPTLIKLSFKGMGDCVSAVASWVTVTAAMAATFTADCEAKQALP